MQAMLKICLAATMMMPAAAANAKEPRYVDLTEKSADQLAGCIALKLAEYSGYETRKSKIAGDTEIRLKFRVAGIAATAATFLIRDKGSQRELTIYATGKETGAPRVIAADARRCASEQS